MAAAARTFLQCDRLAQRVNSIADWQGIQKDRHKTGDLI
ncbi:hypothetical protein BSLA_03r0891 [Burkholderia stabilis]|nr:hypothetical protein BSLA_03r0891 [Burkholderia stabilis]